MLDIAFTEILFISVLALILLGPKELPVVLRMLGRWVAKCRAVSETFQKHLYDMELEKEYKEAQDKPNEPSPQPCLFSDNLKKKGPFSSPPHLPKNGD